MYCLPAFVPGTILSTENTGLIGFASPLSYKYTRGHAPFAGVLRDSQ